MRDDHKEPFFDLKEAGELARRLRGDTRLEPERTPGGFVRFTAPSPRLDRSAATGSAAGPPAPPGGVEVPAPIRQAAASFGPDALGTVLDWARETTRADTVFVMNEQGLVVGQSGANIEGELEGIGSRLMISLDQAAQMGPLRGDLRAVVVEFGAGWLTGLRVTLRSSSHLTIGIIGASPLAPEMREIVASLLRNRFSARP